jgi:hypothetical protein
LSRPLSRFVPFSGDFGGPRCEIAFFLYNERDERVHFTAKRSAIQAFFRSLSLSGGKNVPRAENFPPNAKKAPKRKIISPSAKNAKNFSPSAQKPKTFSGGDASTTLSTRSLIY